MTLWELPENSSARIEGFVDPKDVICNRLEDLGFCAGLSITCLRKTSFGGPRVYQVNDSVFSLESKVAGNIRVTIL